MARVEANPTPTLLVWARESAGLSVEAAAKRAAVDADRISAWESAKQKPTFAQLRKLAAVYRRPLAIFYLETPPKGFAPMHDFRRAAARAQVPTSPELTLEIRRAHDRRDWALELFTQIEEKPPEMPNVTLARNTEAAAAAVRRLLRVTMKEQTTWRTDYEAFKQWRLLIERAGVLTFQANDVETAEARGFSVADRPLPVAVANIKDAPRGCIFTLLHEVIHILLRESGICDLHCSVASLRLATASSTVGPWLSVPTSGHSAT